MNIQQKNQMKRAFARRMEREDLIKHSIRREHELNDQIAEIKSKSEFNAPSPGRIASNLEG